MASSRAAPPASSRETEAPGQSRPRSRGLRTLATVAALTVVVGGLAGGWNAGAVAQSAGPTSTTTTTLAPDAPRLVLIRQDPWTAVGGWIGLTVRTEGTVPGGAELALGAFPAVNSRIVLDRTFGAAAGTGLPLTTVTIPLDQLPAGDGGARAMALPLATLRANSPGVYPFEVELRDAQRVRLHGFLSALVVVPGDAGIPTLAPTPLSVSWVWPLDSPPAFGPDGRAQPEVVALLGPGGRLGHLAAALARHADVPLTLVPAPETLESWGLLTRDDPSLAGGLAALRGAGANREILGAPYVPLDLPSLLGAGLGEAADAELAKGADELRRVYGSQLDTATAFVDPLDDAALDHLRGRDVAQVVVRADAVEPAVTRLTPARPFELTTGNGADSTTALESDAGLEAILGSSDAPALRAQRFLATLSLVATELPSVIRGVTVVNPDGFDADPVLLDAILGGLASNPLLHPVTVAQHLATVPEEDGSDAPRERKLARHAVTEPPVSAFLYVVARSRIDGFRTILPADDPLVTRAEHLLLTAFSNARTGSVGPAQALADVDGVTQIVRGFLSGIKVPDPGRITITARAGALPLTFRNDTGRPIRIQIRLTGDNLTFPRGPRLDVDLGPRSTTVRFPVEARTSGTFPVGLTVTAADGRLPVTDPETVTFFVQSTFVNSVGLAVAAGALAFLAVWWARDILRRRRRRTLLRRAP